MQPYPDLRLRPHQLLTETVSCFLTFVLDSVSMSTTDHNPCIGKVVCHSLGRRGVSILPLNGYIHHFFCFFCTSSVLHTLLHPWRCPRTGLHSLHHICLSGKDVYGKEGLRCSNYKCRIRTMKAMCHRMCENAKDDMRHVNQDELGSWSHAITSACAVNHCFDYWVQSD